MDKKLTVGVIGLGYVGGCAVGTFAEWGFVVIGTDVVSSRVKMLEQGHIPIYEPGLEELIKKNKDRITFTSDARHLVEESDIVFICVGTPSEERARMADKYFHRHDLTYVDSVACEIAPYFNGPKVIVDKSTVPVETAQRVKETLRRHSHRTDFAVVSNPETLREGRAVEDCLNPDVIILGVDEDWAYEKMKALYSLFEDRIVRVNVNSAEISKLALNAYLAKDISFINLVAQFCESSGADIQEVVKILSRDKRVGKFIQPGLGYGGSCFPKDVESLYSLMVKKGMNAQLLRSVLEVNDSQVHYFTSMIVDKVYAFKHKQYAVLGTAFKDNTDDVRCSRSLEVLKELTREGVKNIRAYDRFALSNTERELRIHGERDGTSYIPPISLEADITQCMNGADVLIIGNEDPQLKALDLFNVRKIMTQGSYKPLWLFEGRKTFDSKKATDAGFIIYSVGQGFRYPK